MFKEPKNYVYVWKYIFSWVYICLVYSLIFKHIRLHHIGLDSARLNLFSEKDAHCQFLSQRRGVFFTLYLCFECDFFCEWCSFLFPVTEMRCLFYLIFVFWVWFFLWKMKWQIYGDIFGITHWTYLLMLASVTELILWC